ncbi:hypothetical protein OQI89_15885 [Lentilactobacillus diolivorans]|uniref:hypothetical protein n=1 Tax=Lentilactobacillus diolivorans TaxID=179838 RepID=UPI002469568B|nr:hypothetical protein [Lentilactobacillus diolivorans]MDH5107302.1 hypothetical protein [Lentilactobacillus diolivorans]
MANNFSVWDAMDLKILADDKKLVGFGPDELFEIQDDGILLNLNILSESLKNFNPHKIKAIYMDEDHTITIKMVVDSIKQLPIKIGSNMPLVPIKLFGEPKVKFTD